MRECYAMAKTRFFVDRLHYKNHKRCSEGYNMDSYNADKELRLCNSEICEQQNRLLRNMATSVSFMRPDNVMLYTSLFLAQLNREKKAKRQK